jgi:hypothetical protein
VFRHVNGTEAIRKLANDPNSTGKVAVTSSHIDNTWFVRVAIGQTQADEGHIEHLWALIDELA